MKTNNNKLANYIDNEIVADFKSSLQKLNGLTTADLKGCLQMEPKDSSYCHQLSKPLPTCNDVRCCYAESICLSIKTTKRHYQF